MRYVRHIEIENGIMNSDLYGRAKTIKGFFSDRGIEPVAIIKTGKGWNFKRVYLTRGDENNGFGFAFV
jgi:hypothetical protein